jgi:Kef-type K+ transport system membrane component KefB
MAASRFTGWRRLNEGGEKELEYLLMFWILSYVSAWLAQITKLSPLLFYLLFGGILTNCDIIEHSPVMDVIAEVAITLVFFALGFEENVSHFLAGIKKAWGIASIGAAVPFACGFGLAMFFWPEVGVQPALMCGLAVTATAVSLTMITLKSKGLEHSKAAIGIMTSAVLDDVAALALVAIMVPIATGEADPTISGICYVLGKCALFFLLVCIMHIIIFPHDLSHVPVIKHIPAIRSLGVHHFLRFNGGEQAVVVSLAFGLGMGLVATLFGFHPAIGAYMAGLLFEESYFDLPLAEAAAEEEERENSYFHVKAVLESAAFCWLGPIFFIHLGSQIKIEVEVMQTVVVESLTLFVFLFFGQIFSAAFAARYVPGGFSWSDAWMIGFGMLGRAELFFVVLDICYIENQIFTAEMFYSLTFASILLNVSVPVTISMYQPYYTGAKTSSWIPGPKQSGAAESFTEMSH